MSQPRRMERINRELKRRSNVIGASPNAASLIRLIGSVLMELNGLALNAGCSARLHIRAGDRPPAVLVAIAAEQ